MLMIHIAALLGLILFLFCGYFLYYRKPSSHDHTRLLLVLLFAVAFLVRLAAAALTRGFDTDMICFSFWADRIFQTGPGGFYSPEVFTDYPPGYMYLLYPIGALRKLLDIPYYSVPHLVLLRMPSILSDLGCGYLLYRAACAKSSPFHARFLCMAYLFNPAIILNSSLWGQVDSLLALTMGLLCLFLVQDRFLPACIAFFLGLLLKPQALLMSPILFAGFLDHVWREKFSLRELAVTLAEGICVLSGAILLCVPFGLENVISQYIGTVSSYAYATVNAYNFWALLGLNWVSQENTFLHIPYFFYAYVIIVTVILLVLFLSLRHRQNREKYPFLGALFLGSIFVFSVRMHERYLYPALLLLLLSFVYKPGKQLFACYGFLSLLHFYNTADVLYFYDSAHPVTMNSLLFLVSAGTVGCLVWLYRIARVLYFPPASAGETCPTWESLPQAPPSLYPQPLPPRPSQPEIPLGKADWLWILAITFLYGCFALADLGDRQAPSTSLSCDQGQVLEFHFDEDTLPPATLSYYIAPWHHRTFSLEGKRHLEDAWADLGTITLENVFTWQDITLSSGVHHLRLTLQDNQASLMEFTFLDENGSVVVPENANNSPVLFDESHLHPARSSFRNSMYFDEIYHGRTGYEFLHSMAAYENTHPPLGKLFIAAGIALFGMNPFGWRIVGTLFGIAMVPLVYLFARKLTRRTPLAALACVLFAFDFMHFVQTRIATIDVYITFFVILMYYFLYQYSTLSFYHSSLARTFLPLGACGVCMGLGIASKWTGVYAGAGLAVLFFSVLLRRYQEYLYAKQKPLGCTGGISHQHVVERFLPYTRRTILFCVGFFVIIPAVIYLLSYLPFRDYTEDGLFLRMLHNQTSMFEYHSQLTNTHSYSSSWYDWPIMKRPVWYYSGRPGDTLREGISAFGNPLVWWAGIPAFGYTLYLWTRKKDHKAAFLAIGYLAQYVPWIFVTRITFLYHYFPSVVFVVLMILRSIQDLLHRKKVSRRMGLSLLALYGCMAFLLFLLFYPVLSGQPVESSFVSRYLRWFDSWVLTAR